jgi:hypothetical protein
LRAACGAFLAHDDGMWSAQRASIGAGEERLQEKRTKRKKKKAAWSKLHAAFAFKKYLRPIAANWSRCEKGGT